MSLIDRRENPSGKSHVNRQRFMRRQQGEMKKAVQEALKGRKLSDDGSQDIVIPNTGEPKFRRDKDTGKREHVVPGNKGNGDGHVVGDTIERPPWDFGTGGGSPDGGGEHDFRIKLNYDEFVKLFLEDMGLPDLLKDAEGGEEKTKPKRAGFSHNGIQPNLDLPKTVKNALARSISLKRPGMVILQEAQDELAKLLKDGGSEEELDKARQRIEELERRRKVIPFIDKVDERYKRFEQKPLPSPQAVMFCLMDVSGSMDEHRQELAKRFYLLLKIFLQKRYKRVDLVFIRHTHFAKEVAEDKFFNDPESGGTVVSTALEAMQRIIKERYPPDRWNIYGAQASDGYNYEIDDKKCLNLMTQPPYGLLPLCQHFAYIQVDESAEQKKEYEKWLKQIGITDSGWRDHETSLWQAYQTLLPHHPNFAMQKVKEKEDIAPVFAKLFGKKERASLAGENLGQGR